MRLNNQLSDAPQFSGLEPTHWSVRVNRRSAGAGKEGRPPSKQGKKGTASAAPKKVGAGSPPTSSNMFKSDDDFMRLPVSVRWLALVVERSFCDP